MLHFSKVIAPPFRKALSVSTNNDHDTYERAESSLHVVDSIGHDKVRMEKTSLLITTEAKANGDDHLQSAENNHKYNECSSNGGSMVSLRTHSLRRKPKETKTTASVINNFTERLGAGTYAKIAG